MKTDVAFTGTATWHPEEGVSRLSPPDKPAYEAVEDYTAPFPVCVLDEYGQSVRSEKNVSGYGYVAVDKRVTSSGEIQSGTGSYQSDENIETPPITSPRT